MSRLKTATGLSLVLSVCGSLCLAPNTANAQTAAENVVAMPVRDTLVYRQYLYDKGACVAEIRFYSNIGGHGGYFQLTNRTGQKRKFRLKIINKQNKQLGRIAHAAGKSDSSKQSCYSAGTRNAGIKHVKLIYSKVE